jgi:hypothetical protein
VFKEALYGLQCDVIVTQILQELRAVNNLQILKHEKAGKKVPLHVMEELGGRGDIALTHSRPRH